MFVMKAVRLHEYGGDLHIEEVPRPVPGAGEVLVRVAATTFNAVDVGLRAGAMAEIIPLAFPYTPGLEVSGTVAEVGAGVRDHAVGEAVIAFQPLPVAGGAAEYAVVPAAALAPAPATVALVDAAALPIAALTAEQALFELGGLHARAAGSSARASHAGDQGSVARASHAGDQGSAARPRVLINGAGGAVGGMAIQLAKAAGATVLATASPRSTEMVRSSGADEIIDYTVTPVIDAVTTQVDLLINLVAGSPDDISRLTTLVADGGRAVSTVPMPLQGDDERGVQWATFNVRNDAPRLADLSAAVDKGDLKLDISARYPFTDIDAVHTAGSSGKFRGKVLLTIES